MDNVTHSKDTINTFAIILIAPSIGVDGVYNIYHPWWSSCHAPTLNFGRYDLWVDERNRVLEPLGCEAKTESIECDGME